MSSTNIYETDFADMLTLIYQWEERYKDFSLFLKNIVDQYNVRSALDAGCGDGLQLCIYKKLSAIERVAGIDKSSRMIQRAFKNLKRYNIHDVTIKHADLLNIDKAFDGTFDLISCIHTLSTLNDEYKTLTILKKFRKLLSISGVLLIEDTNGDRLLSIKPPPEYLPIKSSFYPVLMRKNIQILAHNNLRIPFLLERNHKCLIIHISSKFLYNWLRDKNFCYRTYQVYEPHVFTNHLIFRSGLLKKPDVRLFRTDCLLLPNKALITYIRNAGFRKITSYSDHRLTSFHNRSFSQIIVAQP